MVFPPPPTKVGEAVFFSCIFSFPNPQIPNLSGLENGLLSLHALSRFPDPVGRLLVVSVNHHRQTKGIPDGIKIWRRGATHTYKIACMLGVQRREDNGPKKGFVFQPKCLKIQE